MGKLCENKGKKKKKKKIRMKLVKIRIIKWNVELFPI